MTGGIPYYLVPSRNRYGLIGPIYPERFAAATVRKGVAANPLSKGLKDKQPVFAVVTNSTYDGLCYNVERVKELLGSWMDCIHFDEAWFGYARFNPLYAGRLAMHGPASEHDPKGPTVFTTHSTHKLLAALSQASYIHLREGRRPMPHGRFNESFMMHGSTSPFYPIIASNEVAASMMDGAGGLALTSESINEAIAFRQVVGRLGREFAKKKEWFFRTWNPDKVKDRSGKKIAFEDAPADLLATDPDCWVLHPGDALARIRQARRRLLHARPDQGHGADARHRGRWFARQGRRLPGQAADVVPPRARHRSGEDQRLRRAVPVLHRHHQGQVGHAAGRDDRLQARLRRRRAAVAADAGPRRGISRRVRRTWAARPGRPHVRRDEEEQPDRAPAEGVLDHPRSPGDSGRRLPGVDPRPPGTRRAARPCQSHGRHQYRARTRPGFR